jgi:hypothetical protein
MLTAVLRPVVCERDVPMVPQGTDSFRT